MKKRADFSHPHTPKSRILCADRTMSEKMQKTLDGVYPGLLTAVFVVGCWYLLSKKKMSPIKVMLLLVVVAFIGVLVGFFNPGLSY